MKRNHKRERRLLLSNALQAALLGAQNSLTPLVALGAAAALNAAGDVLLVCGAKLGLSGAAAATVLSQWAGLAFLLRAANKTLPMPSFSFSFSSSGGGGGGAEEDSAKAEAARVAGLKMRESFYAFCPPIM